MKTNVREAGGVQVVELKGKITIGSGDVQLRETINKLVDSGKKNILVDMNDVTTIDSSGIGELVGCYTSVTNKGGKLKLLHLPPKINDVLTVTQLITVFDVYESEPEAVASSAARKPVLKGPAAGGGAFDRFAASARPALEEALARGLPPPAVARGIAFTRHRRRGAVARKAAASARGAGRRRARRAPTPGRRAPWRSRSSSSTRLRSCSTTCRRWTTRRAGGAARRSTASTASPPRSSRRWRCSPAPSSSPRTPPA